MTEFAFGAATHVGKVRPANQDQLLTSAPVFVVADGMGGHHGGEIAAAVAVDSIQAGDVVSSLDDLIERVQAANSQIVDRAKFEPELKGMGTTMVMLVGIERVGPNRLGIANVGDSRLYRLDGHTLHQHTEDHSLVEALVRDGRLTREEAAVHPQRNIVTRALGIDEKVLVDAWELVPVVGDRYLLCSDGLFSELSEDAMAQILVDTVDPQEAAELLVTEACDAGGRDNVTVVIVDVTAADSIDDLPDDRVTDVRKALPDGVLKREMPKAGDEQVETDPHPDEIVRGAQPAVLTWRLGVFVVAVIMVLAVLFTSITVYARSAYFIGDQDQQVVI